MKKTLALLTTTIIFLSFLTACNMDNSEPTKMTIRGVLHATKDGAVVDDIFLTDFTEVDTYAEKTVEVTGMVEKVEGGPLMNEAGEYSQGFEGTRNVMTEVELIEIVGE
ncbi:hypothetical protein HOG48_01360 [Candidatus Peregrinibacteria bacterium]|nr:hypothetical protein [Candidatus Peregrinibacteria bacterium]